MVGTERAVGQTRSTETGLCLCIKAGEKGDIGTGVFLPPLLLLKRVILCISGGNYCDLESKGTNEVVDVPWWSCSCPTRYTWKRSLWEYAFIVNVDEDCQYSGTSAKAMVSLWREYKWSDSEFCSCGRGVLVSLVWERRVYPSRCARWKI